MHVYKRQNVAVLAMEYRGFGWCARRLNASASTPPHVLHITGPGHHSLVLALTPTPTAPHHPRFPWLGQVLRHPVDEHLHQRLRVLPHAGAGDPQGALHPLDMNTPFPIGIPRTAVC